MKNLPTYLHKVSFFGSHIHGERKKRRKKETCECLLTFSSCKNDRIQDDVWPYTYYWNIHYKVSYSPSFHPSTSTVFLMCFHMSFIRFENCMPFARPIFFLLLRKTIPIRTLDSTNNKCYSPATSPLQPPPSPEFYTLRLRKHHIRPFALILHAFPPLLLTNGYPHVCLL